MSKYILLCCDSLPDTESAPFTGHGKMENIFKIRCHHAESCGNYVIAKELDRACDDWNKIVRGDK